jgi:hypothetical protein
VTSSRYRESVKSEERIASEFDSQNKQLDDLSERVTALQSQNNDLEHHVDEKILIRRQAKMELRKWSSKSKQLNSQSIKTDEEVRRLRHEVEKATHDAERLQVVADTAADRATKASQVLNQAQAKLPASKVQVRNLQEALGQWVSGQKHYSLKHAQSEAARLTSKAQQQVRSIKSEMDSEVEMLHQKAAETAAQAKQRYEEHLKRNENSEDDAQSNIAGAQAHADAAEEEAERSQSEQLQSARKQSKHVADIADRNLESYRATITRKAATEIRTAGATALAMRNQAKNKAKMVITEGMTIEKQADEKVKDAETAQQELSKLSDEKMLQGKEIRHNGALQVSDILDQAKHNVEQAWHEQKKVLKREAKASISAADEESRNAVSEKKGKGS